MCLSLYCAGRLLQAVFEACAIWAAFRHSVFVLYLDASKVPPGAWAWLGMAVLPGAVVPGVLVPGLALVPAPVAPVPPGWAYAAVQARAAVAIATVSTRVNIGLCM